MCRKPCHSEQSIAGLERSCPHKNHGKLSLHRDLPRLISDFEGNDLATIGQRESIALLLQPINGY